MNRPASLASHLVVGLAGPQLHPAERAWFEAAQPAGVILFGRNVVDHRQVAGLCAGLHALVPGLEIVADHEGGPVSVLAAALGRAPAAATLGLLDDEDLTRRVWLDSGRRLAACGIDRVLAPVADVLTCLRNPVIGGRAFGSDAGIAARHVAAAVEGLGDAGVAACLKHWPGHGGTAADSHLGAASLAAPEPVAPFAAGLAAGADAVMVAHVEPPGGGLPASLDPAQAAAARALAPGRPLRLYADDITMGALRGPLSRRGLAVPGGTGLIDPADLTAGWCAALLGGGCDRLLVRGIPWAAWPECSRGPGLQAAAMTAAAVSRPGDAASWTEARSRLAALLPADFGGAGRSLAWVDRTAGDRWGPLATGEGAAGLPGAVTAAFAAIAEGPRDDADRLLVTSHRPLDPAREGPWAARCGAGGVALAVGHPALAEDLRGLLPVGWRVVGLPEWPVIGPSQNI